jgi:hypothetical protein
MEVLQGIMVVSLCFSPSTNIEVNLAVVEDNTV